MSQQLLTTGAMADRLGVDRSTVHRRIAAAGLEPVHVAGKVRLFDLAEVEALFAKADQ